MPMNAAKLLLLNVLSGGGAAAPFSPLDIPGLALWLDASDSTTLFQDSAGTTPATADNDVVGRWADKSGNARHVTQTTTANKPLLKLAVQNGKSVVRFDSSNDYLTASFGTTISQPGTLLSVFRMGSGSVPFVIDGIIEPHRWALYGTSGNLYMYAGTALSLSTAFPTPTTIATALLNGASSIGRIDGTQKASGDAGTGSLTGVVLGARTSLNMQINGDINEILLYAGALSTPNIEALEAYLNAKWGVY